MSVLIESPKSSAPTEDRRSPFARRLAISALRLFVVAAIAGLLVGGWYLAKKGFGRKTRHRITEELHKHGIEAKIGHLTLDPFRGLVARDVRIYDYRNRENTIGLISEISLDLNYAALFHNQPFLNALDVRNAQLTFPLPGTKGRIDKPELKRFNAHIYFPPEQIYVRQVEGNFCGIQISATGQLIKRDNYQPSPPLSDEEWASRLSTLQRFIGELQKCSFPSGHPSLQIKFNGDLADMENARVEATLRCDEVRRDNYAARNLIAIAEFADQRLNVKQCEWKDPLGTLSATGNWSRQSSDLNFQARSDIDLKTLLEAVGANKILNDATFAAPPLIEFSGSGNLGGDRPQFKVLGHATASGFTFRNVPFTSASTQFSWDGERTLLRDIRLRHQSGELSADVLDAPNDFRVNIDSTITPSALSAFGPPDSQKFLKEWEWARPPTIHLAIRGSDRNPSTWQGEGTLALDRTRFRGTWMNNATANVRFGDGAVTYENLRVTRDEGVGTGDFTYDFKKHEVRIASLKTTLNPAEIVFWIDPDLHKVILPYKFRHAPNVSVSGVYQFAGGKNTRLDIAVDGAGMDYVFLGKTLSFDRINSKLIFTHDRLQIVDLKGGLFSGSVKGGADISLAHNDPHYRANITVKDIDFPRLTDLYYNYKTSQGRLSGTYEFGGLGSDSRTMHGNGKLEVADGDVFAIPIFGPLSGILSNILPGSGYSVARKASATLKIKDGIIHTDDFETSGKLFSMLGHGDIHFLDDKLAFEIRMDMHGAGILLAPVYKLFEYTGEGSLKKPDWHPKRF